MDARDAAGGEVITLQMVCTSRFPTTRSELAQLVKSVEVGWTEIIFKLHLFVQLCYANGNLQLKFYVIYILVNNFLSFFNNLQTISVTSQCSTLVQYSIGIDWLMVV